MIETLTITTLALLYLIFFRPGKTPPLDRPLVIERPGNYHMTLAPQLNLAQPFIESIAAKIGAPRDTTQYSETQCFEVRDRDVTAHGHDSYMLAITQRNGMLYFQAASPQSDDPDSRFSTIREFADAVLTRFPTAGEHNMSLGEGIVTATQQAAQLRNVYISRLPKA